MNWVFGFLVLAFVIFMTWLTAPLEAQRMERAAKVRQRKKELGTEDVPML